MKILLKAAIAALNLIFACLKLLPVQNKIVYLSRQADEKSEDMQLLEEAVGELTGGRTRQVFLCKTLSGNLLHKAGYCLHIFRQMYHLATARVAVLDSYCIAVSVLRQRRSLAVIQMWHALGALKKFGYSIVDKKEGSSSRLAAAMKMHQNYTCILASSKASAPHFAEAFGYPAEAVRVMSLPRVDRLTDQSYISSTREKIYQFYPQARGKSLVVYAPTFRRGRDISRQIEELAAQFGDEYFFVLKKHPLMKAEKLTCFSDEHFTTIEMLTAADHVICDYSAVIFEAAVMRKPLYFYTFDYDQYRAGRDFYIDYMAEMPGPISADAAKLADAVKQGLADPARVDAFARRYVENQKHCSRRLAEMIASNLKRKG